MGCGPAGRGAVVIHGGGGSSDVHSMDCSAAELEELIKEVSVFIPRLGRPSRMQTSSGNTSWLVSGIQLCE